MKKLLIFVFIFCARSIFCQGSSEIDSLFSVLKIAKADTNKVLLLCKVAGILCDQSELQRSDSLSVKALELSDKLNFPRGTANANANRGSVCLGSGDMKGALIFYEKALAIFRYIGRAPGVAGVLFFMGRAYDDLGEYPKSLECYLKALPIQEKLKNQRAVASLYENIANVYIGLKDLDKAMKYFTAAMNIFNSINDNVSIARTLNDIGIVYRQRHEYEKALSYYKRSLELTQGLGDIDGMASACNNIGVTFDDQAKVDSSFKYLKRSLDMRTQLNDKEGMTCSLFNIGNLYYNMENLKQAEFYLNKSFPMAEEIGSLVYQMETQNLFSLIYDKRKEGNKALEHYKKYIILRDSMLNKENSERIVRLEMGYEFDKKEAAIRAEQDKKDAVSVEEKKQIFYISVGLGILVMFTISIAWLMIRQNKLRAKQQATQLEQKLLRTQMNPHFIFNSLTAIESYIYKNQPREAGRYLSGFARLMRLILENSREESITLEKEIKTLEHYLELQKLRYEDKFDYKISIDESIDMENTLIPPMLAQPAIENSIEHGIKYLENTKGQIEVSFVKKGNELVLEIRDNGVGLQRSLVLESGTKTHIPLATTITQERIKMLNRGKTNKIKIKIEEIKDAIDNICGTRTLFTMPYREA